MRIKICGITNIEDARFCEDAGADALGFILYPGSKRYIEPERLKIITAGLGPFMIKVGVFVNETVENVNQIAAECGLSMVQLHGEEDQTYIQKIKLPVIKGFRVTKNFHYDKLENYHNCYFLLDAFSESEYGGSGHTFDWQNIPVTLREKIILAGGITRDNLEQIFTKIKPAAIDLSSSIEKEPGIKDHKKVSELFQRYNELRKTHADNYGS